MDTENMDTFYSTAVQYCSRYNISTKNRIHIYYLLCIYFCVWAGCVDIYGADRTCTVYLTSGRWRRTGRKGPNVTNLQQICNINIAAAAPCCTLLHPRPSLAAKCQSGNSSQKKVPRQPRDILSNIEYIIYNNCVTSFKIYWFKIYPQLYMKCYDRLQDRIIQLSRVS